MNTPSAITPELVRMIKRTRFNPIATLTPEVLSRQLESFASGYLRDFAITGEAIERRDDVITVALPKRKAAPARRPYVVQPLDGLDPAQAERAKLHQAALKYFWDNVTVRHALEGDVSGGFKLLVRQMMSAVSLRYAVHEIAWTPRVVANEDRLTATFTHVPLQFFEATTGKLRFLRNYLGQIDGEEMPATGWLVTVGPGIMEALSVAYMFKQLSLKDWVSYSEKFGTPGLLAKTTAAKDSAEWQVVVEAVEAFGQDWSAVVNEGSSIELIEAKGAGSLPFPSLVERMDRAIATICRGADLSTLSAGSGAGQGASLQGDEGDLMEQDDAELITETLQRIDRIIIAQLYGEEPLAYVQIQVPKRPDNADTRANLTLLRDSGVPVSAQWARDQFGVPAPLAGEATLTAPAPAAAPGAFSFANAAAAGKAALFRTEALRSLKAAQVKALQPLIARIVAVADLPDARFDAGLATLKADLPALAKEILSSDASGELARAFESILGTALVSGAATAAEKQAAAK